MTWETNRLLLHPLVFEDLEALYQLYSQAIVMQYITWPAPFVRKDTGKAEASYR